MVDIEYSPENMFSKISIGSKINNSAMLRSIPDHLKTKKMCKNAVKNRRF